MRFISELLASPSIIKLGSIVKGPVTGLYSARTEQTGTYRTRGIIHMREVDWAPGQLYIHNFQGYFRTCLKSLS